MLLSFSNGDKFSTGSTLYDYRPATRDERFERIMLQVQIEGIMTEAFVDTGGVYLVCTPEIAQQANLQARSLFSPDPEVILLRGVHIAGDLFRVTLTLLADYGEGVNIEATAFVPRREARVDWADFPCILGMHGCLERLRFAIDTLNTCFYFGASSE